MNNKVTVELLDKLDAEHDQLVQPKALDKDVRRLARIGLERESKEVMVQDYLTHQVLEEMVLSRLTATEREELEKNSRDMFNTLNVRDFESRCALQHAFRLGFASSRVKIRFRDKDFKIIVKTLDWFVDNMAETTAETVDRILKGERS